jgi:hypothetical protein
MVNARSDFRAPLNAFPVKEETGKAPGNGKQAGKKTRKETGMSFV